MSARGKFIGGISETRDLTWGDLLQGTIKAILKLDPKGVRYYAQKAHDDRVRPELIEKLGARATAHALQALHSQKGRDVQYKDEDVKVEVLSGWSRKFRCVTTDILVFDRHDKKVHYHIIISEEEGEILYEGQRLNHV